MNEELKPCPFCNGEPVTDNPDPGIHAVYCKECGVYMSGDISAGEDVFKKWNKRASDAEN